MRILALCQRGYFGLTPAGGAETMIHDIMRHFVDISWEAQATFNTRLYQVPAVDTSVDGVDVFPRRGDGGILDQVSMCDAIITHLGATPRAKALGKKYNKPVIQLVHNTNHFTVGFLGSGCDMAIYNSNWVRDFHEKQREQGLIWVWRKPKKSSLYIRDQFEWPSVTVRPPAVRVSNTRGYREGVITLVNLTDNKGPDVFYKLAEMNPDLQFMGVIGGYEESVQDIRDLPNVTIHPHTPNISSIYSRSSIVLVPSKYESYSRVAVEAMEYGVPVISSGTPGLRECLGSAGIHCDRSDLDSWNSALRDVMSDYSGVQQSHLQRYQELVDQTPADLSRMATAIEDLVKKWQS